jgi:hypothetical protein
MLALIGKSGLIGGVLKSSQTFDAEFNSSDIVNIQGQHFDTVYCAAPSGNRLLATRYPEQDTHSVHSLIENLKTITANRFVLISSVDVVHAPESVYGHSRRQLEKFVKTKFTNHHVIRLCTLIHHNIKKNILYDLKHRLYLDKINGDEVRQYYPLSRLTEDINVIIDNNIQEINLVSEPIQNRMIVDRFFPDQPVNHIPCDPYNLSCGKPPFGHYVLTKNECFDHIEQYIK